MDVNLAVKTFLKRFVEWSKRQDNILAVGLAGSYAKGTSDEFSDIDLVIITSSPASYLDDDQWIHDLGQVREKLDEDWGLVQSRRVFYNDGVEVEFGITGTNWTATDPIDPGTRQVIENGFIILSDPMGFLKRLVQAIDELSSKQAVN